MPQWRADQASYRSPKMAMQTPHKGVVFVALLGFPRTGPHRMGRSRQLSGCRGRLSATELVTLSQTVASRPMNVAAGLVPDSWSQRLFMLRVMGFTARYVLGTGKMNLAGRTPNGQEFIANPQQVWLVKSSRAVVNGVDVGTASPLPEQARLHEFLIPQRGIFAVGRSLLGTTDRVIHVSRAGRGAAA